MKVALSPNFRCPSCRGARLVLGSNVHANSNFVPQGKFMMLGFATYPVACLDCGCVGASLAEKDLLELAAKVGPA